MSERSLESGDDLSLSTSRLELIVALCDEFERVWRQGQRPRIENYLAGHVTPYRSALLYELLAVELDLRTERADNPTLEEYLVRFPDQAPLIRCIFESACGLEHSTRTDLLTTQFKMLPGTMVEARDSVLSSSAGDGRLSARARSLARTENGNAPRATDLLKLHDRFTLIRLIGVGTCGEVYLARDEVLDREVAVKLPRPAMTGLSTRMTTSLSEARNAAQLRHPGIVTIYDVVTLEDGTVFVVMEYVEGSTLRRIMKAGAVGTERAATLIALVAEALHYAHSKGFVHRDIKPANILIDTTGQPRVADFGLAVREEALVARTGELAGTIPYMAPEQVQCETHRLDGRTDVWALGVILYEILTGERPFAGNDRATLFRSIVSMDVRPPRELDNTIPRELERICLCCLSKRMTDRYSTAAALADDLRNWLAGRPLSEESSIRRRVALGPVQVIPKGLRSFSLEDAAFFLELIPGPRDRDGLPEIVRFWKTRIDATNRAMAFPVGLIFGPSGCGKSSLVHAGILPRLAESVVIVSVAATASANATENELSRRLAQRSLGLVRDDEDDLAAALRRLRQGIGLPMGKKLLIVLDQFEQYLQSGFSLERSALLEALRQCDGEHVQCLILVRDDFWMALSRFLRLLEIDLSSDRNMTAVDLFDRRHARAVLAAFGRGYGALPIEPETLTGEQKKFLDEAIDGLAEDDRIICVRLALFAEMFKERPWTPASLKDLGGIQGVGVAFLEATIGSQARHPILAQHSEAARTILESLLPTAGSPLKGRMRSYAELLTATGYRDREPEFRELLRVLDSEPRLLTLAEETKATRATARGFLSTVDGESPSSSSDPSQSLYQLTHDYLVPSIRDWLERKLRETKRGRALYRLAGLTTVWSSRPEPRNLPSFLEWLTIRWHTRPRDWSPVARVMMREASRRLGIWLLTGWAALALLALAGWWLIETQRRHALLDQLDTVRAERIPTLVADLRPLRHVLRAPLQRKLGQVDPASEARLAISLIDLPDDFTQVDFLVRRVQEADVKELKVIGDELGRYEPTAAADACWSVVRNPATPSNRRLRAAAVLAMIDHDSPAWRDEARGVAAALVQENASLPWIPIFQPIHRWLKDSLRIIYDDEQAALDKRVIAGIILSGFFSTKENIRPDELVDLVLNANPEQFRFVFPVLMGIVDPLQAAALKRSADDTESKPDDRAVTEYRKWTLDRLNEELLKQVNPKWPDNRSEPNREQTLPGRSIIDKLAEAEGICTANFAFCQTLPLTDFATAAEELRSWGFRPTCARPYTALGKVLIAATWTRDGLPWQFACDLTAEAAERLDKTYRRQWERTGTGYLPVDIAPYLPAARHDLALPRDHSPERFAALWVGAERGPDGIPRSLEFIDSKMYTGVKGEHNHFIAYKNLINAKFVPRTNVMTIDELGQACYSSVRWKLEDPPRDRDTWNEKTWQRVETVVNRALDGALMPIDARFSALNPENGFGYATTWWSGIGFESRAVTDLRPSEHLRKCQELAALGFRSLSIAAHERTDGKTPGSSIIATSIWRRPLVAEEDKDELASRQAVAVIALLLLGQSDPLWRALDQRDDNRLRSELIEHLAVFEIDPAPLIGYLTSAQPTKPSIRRAVLMALANIPAHRVPGNLVRTMQVALTAFYRDDPDRGIHAAAELVLHNWKLDQVLKDVQSGLAREARPIPRLDRESLAVLDGREWFIAPGGRVMVVLPSPIEFTMGSPGGEPLRDHVQEPLRPRRVDRTIAVDTKEVTVSQFLRFFPEHANATRFELGPECPVTNVSWYQALAYCNKLSMEEGLDPCYPEIIGPGMTLDPDLLKRNGYRLPTELEAEYYSRAGTKTTWYFGHLQHLVSRYGWTVFNSGTRSHPVGQLLPNDFGLFDTVGNVFEWCQDRFYPEWPGVCDESSISNPASASGDVVDGEQERVMRGGSFFYVPLQARSAFRDKNRVKNGRVYLGFRVVRTLPVVP